MKCWFVLALLLCVVPKLHAATIFFTGIESGDFNELDSNTGTASIQATTVRTGTYAVQTNPTTTAVGNFILAGIGSAGGSTGYNNATVYHRFYYRYATKPATNNEEIFRARAAAAIKFQLRINSAGNLIAYQQDLVALSTGTTVLNSGTWYRIEVRVGTAVAGSGVWEVKIDGVSEMSGTTADLLNSNNTRCNFGKTTNYNGNTVDYFYDDMLISDSAYPGDGQVSILYPNVNGSSTTWTIGAGAGSNYENVDEIPPDNDTTYLLSTNVANDYELVHVIDSATAGITGTIQSGRCQINVKRNGAANGTIRIRMKSGSTFASAGANFAPTAAYGTVHIIQDTDPATSAAWTTSGLDGIQVGASEQQAAANTSRMTSAYYMVDYVPAAGGAITPKRALTGAGT